MTCFAGVYARSAADQVPDALRESIDKALSRHPGEKIVSFARPLCHLAKFDAGIYGAPAAHEDADGSVSMLVGDPLLGLPGRAVDRTRDEDLRALHEEFLRGQHALARRSREQFAAVFYDPSSHRLRILADRLAIRPVYVHEGERFVIFATSLRVMEALDAVPKRVDLVGTVEEGVNGIALAGRSPYSGIRRLGVAEAVEVEKARSHRFRYWEWDLVAEEKAPVEELARRASELMRRAVRDRLRTDRRVVATLSGGLDSRGIVALLREAGAEVATITYGQQGMRDISLASGFAAAAATHHILVRNSVGVPDDSVWERLGPSVAGLENVRALSPEHPHLFWHGYDASFMIGYVHIRPEMIDHLRRGEDAKAVDLFLSKRRARYWRSWVRSSLAEEVVQIPRRAMLDGIAALRCSDPGRRLWLFHLTEECRALMTPNFENQDLRRLDFHMPFADGDLLELIAAVPVDACLRHEFYMRILQHFPPVTLSVPWQSYPGHVPCPLPVDDSLPTQWAHSPEAGRNRRRFSLRKARVILGNRFPREVFRRSRFLAGMATHAIGLRDITAGLRQVGALQHHLAVANGLIDLPPALPEALAIFRR